MATDGDVWHLVEARRDDGTPAMFRIRDLEPRLAQPRIFVVEMPYPVTELSRLPDAASYRRAAQFEEQWIAPACATLGWTLVAIKTEDGSFFLYLYGAGDPLPMIEKLSPFDGALGFFDEEDPQWDEYAALRELLDEANAMPPETPEPAPPVEPALSSATRKSAASKPKAPAAKQPTPAAKKPTPAAKKPTPAAKKPTPAAKKPTPAAKQPTPAAKQPTPAAKQPTPAAKQPTPAAKKPAVKKQPKKPVAKKHPNKPVAKKKPSKRSR